MYVCIPCFPPVIRRKQPPSNWDFPPGWFWQALRFKGLISCSNPEQTTLNLRGLYTTIPCGGNAVQRAMFCRQCRKLDTAVSRGYKGNAQSTTEASSLLDGVRRAQWICLFYPVIKWAEGKGVQELKPAICWLECVCVCVDFMWLADSPRLSYQSLCVCVHEGSWGCWFALSLPRIHTGFLSPRRRWLCHVSCLIRRCWCGKWCCCSNWGEGRMTGRPNRALGLIPWSESCSLYVGNAL